MPQSLVDIYDMFRKKYEGKIQFFTKLTSEIIVLFVEQTKYTLPYQYWCKIHAYKTVSWMNTVTNQWMYSQCKRGPIWNQVEFCKRKKNDFTEFTLTWMIHISMQCNASPNPNFEEERREALFKVKSWKEKKLEKRFFMRYL